MTSVTAYPSCVIDPKAAICAEIKKGQCDFDKFDESLKRSHQIAMAAVTTLGTNLAHFPFFSDNREVVEAAVGQGGISALKFAHATLQDDPALVENAVKKSAWLFNQLSDKHRNNIHLAALALSTPPGATFDQIGQELQKNRAAILSMVKESPVIFEQLPDQYRDDAGIALAAVKGKGSMMQFASGELRKNEMFVKQAFRANRDSLDYADKTLLETANVYFDRPAVFDGY